MTFKNGEPTGTNLADAVEGDLVAAVRADLAAIGQLVFGRAVPLSLDERLSRLRATVERILGPEHG
jgi:hypothetical protein